jgi:hypothetical protein
MTAEVFTAVVRPASTFSPQRRWGGSYTLDATAVTALSGMTEFDTLNTVLGVCSDVTKYQHVVAANRIGKAASVLT